MATPTDPQATVMARFMGRVVATKPWLGQSGDGPDQRRHPHPGPLPEGEGTFTTERSPDIRLAVWIKLLGNLSFNPVAALTGYLMNQIVADEDVLGVIRALMLEGMAVSKHYGYVMPMTPDQRIDLARQLG